MIQPKNFRLFPASASYTIGPALCLLIGLLFSSCQNGGFSDAATGPKDTTVVTAGFATLRISNKVTQDPSLLTFYLYPPNAVDWSNAVNAKKLGEVATDSTRTFQVPSGNWKVACQNKSNVLEPMEDVASGGGEWLQSVLDKDGVYALILTSNADRIVWTPSYKTVPAMSSN